MVHAPDTGETDAGVELAPAASALLADWLKVEGLELNCRMQAAVSLSQPYCSRSGEFKKKKEKKMRTALIHHAGSDSHTPAHNQKVGWVGVPWSKPMQKIAAYSGLKQWIKYG